MGADGHGGVGIVELVGGAEVELGVVALAADADGGVGAGEGEHARDGGVIRGVADGHALEYGVLDVNARVVPLDDEGRTGGDGLACGVGEVQGQRAAGEVARRGVERHGLHAVAAEGAARRADAERQAEGVPGAVLVEGAAAEGYGEGLACVVGDGGGVVGGVGQGEAGLEGRLSGKTAEHTGGEGAGVDVAAAVGEGLAVGYCYGAAFGADAAGGDAVVGAGPAEGEGGAAVGRGVDADGVDAGGGGGEVSAKDAVHFAVDGEGVIAVGGDGEGAAPEGDVGGDAFHQGAAGGDADVAAVLLVVGHIDAIRCAVVAEGAGGGGVEALAVDGEVGASIDAPHVAVEGHGLAVGEDEGDVAGGPDFVGVGDVGADVVGAGGEAYVAITIHGLMSVEGDGERPGGAVGCHVADYVLLSVAAEGFGIDVHGHVGIGHGECGAAEGACAGGVAVLVAEGCAGVREGEADYIAAAGIEHIHYIIII